LERQSLELRIEVPVKAWTDTAKWIVTAGAIVFILALFLSAYWEPGIRWLHFFQSWMYVAAIGLVWNRGKWGYFVGFGAALFWNYTTLFVNTFLKNGWDQGQILLHSGRLPRPDLFIAVPAWVGNLTVLVGCVVGYLLTSKKTWSDLLRCIFGLVATLAYFALIVAICQPRYLPLFRGALHPRLHW
jgi:hypothetical protein